MRHIFHLTDPIQLIQPYIPAPIASPFDPIQPTPSFHILRSYPTYS